MFKRIGRGVKIGDKHTRADWDLIPKQLEIGFPEPKIVEVELPGGDGTIDMTEALTGAVAFRNRKGSFEFEVIEPYKNWHHTVSKVASHCHGRKHRVILPDDPHHFYVSRLWIESFSNERTVGRLVLTVESEPYKYNVDPTIYRVTIRNGTATIDCDNARKRVLPTLTLSHPATLIYQGRTMNLPAGSTRTSDVIFEEGSNHLEFIGQGGTTVEIEYREGTF